MNKILALLLVTPLSVCAGSTVMDIANAQGCTHFYQEVAESDLMNVATQEDGDFAPFTVFAPTNDAMQALVEAGDEKQEAVKDVIKSHVVPANNHKTAAQLVTAKANTLMTVDAKQIVATKDNDQFIINLEGYETTATIAGGTAHKASNGTVYIIDQVLRPLEDGDEEW